MSKVIVWYRNQVYQWHRAEYLRWFNRSLWGALGILIVGAGVSLLIRRYVYPALDMEACIAVIGLLSGMLLGGAFTLKLVDEHEKKLAHPGL